MAQTNTVGDIANAYSGTMLEVTPSGTGNDGVLSKPNMLVALYNTDNVTLPLGGSAAPLYVLQGYAQAPGSQAPLAGDTVSAQRNYWSPFLSYNQQQLATPPANTTVYGASSWLGPSSAPGNANAGVGGFAELAFFFRLDNLNPAGGGNNTAFQVGIDCLDAYSGVYHLLGLTALTMTSPLLVGLGSGATQTSTSGIGGVNLAGTGLDSHTTTIVGIPLPFGDTVRFTWSYTSGGSPPANSGPIISVSIKGK